MNAIAANVSAPKYNFDYVTCFEKPLAISLSRFGDAYQRAFLLLLKFSQLYPTELLGLPPLYIVDFAATVKDIVERELGLRLNIAAPTPDRFHATIREIIDRGELPLVTVNLKELYYSKYFQKREWGHLLLVTGYDKTTGLYHLFDSTTADQYGTAKEGEQYERFCMTEDTLGKLYAAYGGTGFPHFVAAVGYSTNGEQPREDHCQRAFWRCVELFAVCSRTPRSVERQLLEAHVSGKTEGGPQVAQHVLDEFGSGVLEIEFSLARRLNYKEVFFEQLAEGFEAYGGAPWHPAELCERCSRILTAWRDVALHVGTNSRLGRRIDCDTLLQPVESLEREFMGALGKVVQDRTPMVPEHPVPSLWDERSDGELMSADAQIPYSDVASRGADPIVNSVLELMVQVLRRSDVASTDNFFRMGGDSISLTRLAVLVIGRHGVEIPFQRFFADPTAEGVARLIADAAQVTQQGSIHPAQIADHYCLSSAQSRVFVVEQLNANSITYNVTIALRRAGRYDLNNTSRALGELISKHEALRTCFTLVDGVPMQKVLAPSCFAVPVLSIGADELDRAIEAFVKPFDLFAGPMVRVLIARLPDEDVLVIDMHHIVVDGVSVGILVRDLECALAVKRNLSLPRLQYRDYACWQQARVSRKEDSQHVQYWVDKLAGNPPRTSLPLDFPRPDVQSFLGDTFTVTINEALTRDVKQLAREADCTLYTVLFAAFNILMYRYTGEDDIIVGTPVHARPHVELQDMVGMFVNMLPIRAYPQGGKRFSVFLEEMKQIALDIYKHQDCQFDVLVDAMKLKGDAAANPLFGIVFALQNFDLPEIVVDGVPVRPRLVKHRVAHFDMVFEVTERSDGTIQIDVEYCTSLFKRASVERFARSYTTLLESVVYGGDRPLRELAILDERERQRILHDFNDTDCAFRDCRIETLIDESAKARPAAIAIESCGRALTYDMLRCQSDQIARELLRRNRGSTLVAVLMDRSPDLVVALVGVLKAGAAYVPIEVNVPLERALTICRSLDITTLMVSPNQLNKAAELAENLDSLGTIMCVSLNGRQPEDADGLAMVGDTRLSWVDGESMRQENSATPLESGEKGSNDLAYVIFTSGSTGTPKGVAVKHKPVVNLIAWVNNTFGINESDRLLFVTSVGFDLSVYDMFGMLAAGGTVLLKTHEEIREPQAIVDALIRERATFWDSAPGALQRLIPYFKKIPKNDAGCLRVVFLSGDWIPLSLPDDVRGTFANAQVVSLGGATEATVWSNWYTVGRVRKEWQSIPYGKPIQNAKYYVLDQDMNPCPIGVPGDLYIGGACLCEGYLNDAELTAGKFVENPYHSGRLYQTGDLAKWHNDGNMEFLGRRDGQVKVAGFRVEIGEVEGALRRHELISDVAVVAKGDLHSEKRLVAYYTGRAEVQECELKTYLGRTLPEYMVPWRIVQLQVLPLTANAKVDRKALAMLDLEKKRSAAADPALENGFGQRLQNVFKDVLAIELGPDDNFFDAGASSITIVEVIAKLEMTTGARVGAVQMFQFPTIRALGEELDRATKGGKSRPNAEESDGVFMDAMADLRRTVEAIEGQQ